MTGVKVCGLTRDEDVRRAVALGAAACGFILSPSPRRVDATRARALGAAAGEALTVAVVTTETPEWIAARLAECKLQAVQLSAGVDGPTVAEVREAAARRGLRPRVIAAADTPDVSAADLTLLDARAPGVYGGTGTALDWAGLAAAGLPPAERLVLAGGLSPDNVERAIATIQPSMVDVGSGVERTPGVKDESLLAAFFAAVARADQSRGATS
jgi:phosphoribosylanthranilate isomerase